MRLPVFGFLYPARFALMVLAVFSIGRTYGQPSGLVPDPRLLPGCCISEEDHQYRLCITDSLVLSLYGNEAVDSGIYLLRHDTLLVRNGSRPEGSAYYLLNLSRKYLTYMWSDNGHIFVFRRGRGP
ncbi:MAG TPA: hypothetical protein VG870_15245 [Chitinophagaceae bacterium]|nr:hypothetical protein [Chitinophagaceae bacterium]